MDFSDGNIKRAGDYLASNAALREAVGAHGDDVLELRPLGMGEHNLNYVFEVPTSGKRYVLRINVARQPFHEDQVGYEYAALHALSECGRAPAPVYLDNSPSAPDQGALVESYCPGQMLDFDNIRPGDLRCAAQIMADMHAAKIPEGGGGLNCPRDPLRALYEECLERFAVYRSSVFEDARITRWVERFINECDPDRFAACPQGESAHIVNTETLASHFIIPEKSARAAAENSDDRGRFCELPGWFVDWERPIIGEVAQDVAYFVAPTTTFWDSEFMFSPEEAAAFVEDYWRAVDGRFARGSFDERFDAFLKMTALRSATWFCRAMPVYHAQGSAHTTSKTMRKFPQYLSDDFMSMLAKDVFGL